MITNEDRISSGHTALDTFNATGSVTEAIQAFCVDTEGSTGLYDELDSVCKDMITNAYHAKHDIETDGDTIESWDSFISAVSTYLRNEEYPQSFVDELLTNAYNMAEEERAEG